MACRPAWMRAIDMGQGEARKKKKSRTGDRGAVPTHDEDLSVPLAARPRQCLGYVEAAKRNDFRIGPSVGPHSDVPSISPQRNHPPEQTFDMMKGGAVNTSRLLTGLYGHVRGRRELESAIPGRIPGFLSSTRPRADERTRPRGVGRLRRRKSYRSKSNVIFHES